MSDADAVAAVNRAFYAAFEARDIDAMAEVWDRSDRAAVTHPGWPTLRGWAKVLTSFEAIFANTPYIQFFLTDEQAVVVGDTGWITLAENILQSAQGTRSADAGLHDSTVAAANLFVRTPAGWRLVLHHGSPVDRAERS